MSKNGVEINHGTKIVVDDKTGIIMGLKARTHYNGAYLNTYCNGDKL